jgi:hypothetical protein
MPIIEVAMTETEFAENRKREGRESKYAEIGMVVNRMTDGAYTSLLISGLLEDFSEVNSDGDELDVVKQIKAYIGKLGIERYGIGRVYRFSETKGENSKLGIYKTTQVQRDKLKENAEKRILDDANLS